MGRRWSTTGQTAVKTLDDDDDDAIATRSLIIERRKWENERRDKVISFSLCSVLDHVTLSED